MPIWASVAGAGVGWALNKYGGGSQRNAPDVYDPFAPSREKYRGELDQFMHGQFTPADPSYNWRMSQGMEAVNRSMAATGGLGSGQQMAELTKFGQGMASQEYDKQFQRLSTLAGAGMSPHISQPNIDTTAQQGLGQFGNLLTQAAFKQWGNKTTPDAGSNYDPNQTYDFSQSSPSFGGRDPFANYTNTPTPDFNYDPNQTYDFGSY